MIHESYNIQTRVTFSNDRKKRYTLIKTWNTDLPRVVALMFNPSRANGIIGDQTVDYLIALFEHQGYGSLEVVNLIATVNGNWRNLSLTDLEYDPDNYKAIKQAMSRSSLVLLAWGLNPLKRTIFFMIVSHVYYI